MNLRDAMRFDGDRAALYLERGWWSPQDTLAQWLVRTASESPHAPAIIGDGQRVSYGELAEAGGDARRGAEGYRHRPGRCGRGAAPQPRRVSGVLPGDLRDRRGHDHPLRALPGSRNGISARALEGVRLRRAGRAWGLPAGADRSRSAGPNPFAEACHRPRRRTGRSPRLLRPDRGRTPRSVGWGRWPPTRSCCSTPRAPRPGPRVCRSRTRASSATPGSAYLSTESGPPDRILSAAPFGHLYGLYSFHLALAAGAGDRP